MLLDQRDGNGVSEQVSSCTQSDGDIALQAAKALVRSCSRFTYWLSGLADKEGRAAFRLWYAYFRVLDDRVDEGGLSIGERLALLTRERQRLEALYEGVRDDPAPSLDYLAHLVLWDRANGMRLRVPTQRMLEALQFEVERWGKPLSYARLTAHFRLEGESYLAALSGCLGKSVNGRPPGAGAALGAKLSHVLRDFHKDIQIGIRNLSPEEATMFALPTDIREWLGSAALEDWTANRIALAENLLASGLRETAHAGFRYRLVFALLVTKYQVYLREIVRLGCQLPNAEPWSWPNAAWRAVSNFATLLFPAASSGAVGRHLTPVLGAGTSLLRAALVMCITRAREPEVVQRAAARGALDARRRRTIRRRLRVATQLGRFAHEHLAPGRGAQAHATAARLYGLWAITILELDNLLDQRGVARAELEGTIESWLHLLRERLVRGGAGRSLQAGSFADGVLFVSLAEEFGEAAAQYIAVRQLEDPEAARARAARFLDELERFLTAQLASVEQGELAPWRDWAWYAGVLLDAKTVPFFQAPLNLFVEAASPEFVTLNRNFRILNRCYRHWQLVDDVADLIDDSERGLVTAPGFILLSQGALARSFLDSELFQIDEAATTDAILRTGLVSGLFADWTLRSPPADDPSWLVRRALQNCEADETLALEDLAATRVDQARRYTNAMQTGSAGEAVAAINESRVVERILYGLDDPCRRRIARRRVLASGAERRMLMILDGLMLHALQKAQGHRDR